VIIDNCNDLIEFRIACRLILYFSLKYLQKYLEKKRKRKKERERIVELLRSYEQDNENGACQFR